jgi:hypothetical protein
MYCLARLTLIRCGLNDILEFSCGEFQGEDAVGEFWCNDQDRDAQFSAVKGGVRGHSELSQSTIFFPFEKSEVCLEPKCIMMPSKLYVFRF